MGGVRYPGNLSNGTERDGTFRYKCLVLVRNGICVNVDGAQFLGTSIGNLWTFSYKSEVWI